MGGFHHLKESPLPGPALRDRRDHDSGQCCPETAVIYCLFQDQGAARPVFRLGGKMRNSHTKSGSFDNRCLQLLLLGLVLGGTVFGCGQIRNAAYPTNFVYLDHREISSEMALLGRYMRQLDEILLDGSTISSDQQERVLAILTGIDETIDTLGADSIRTNHLLIDDHIDQFRTDLSSAIHDARASPPNYFGLGRLSGSCSGCHKYRR